MVNRGFSLAEVVVALTVIGVGVMAVAAGLGTAARVLRQAVARERALAAASLVMDSLLAEPEPAAGSLDLDGQRVRWLARAAGGTVLLDVVVEYDDGTAVRRLGLAALHAPPLPVLPDSS